MAIKVCNWQNAAFLLTFCILLFSHDPSSLLFFAQEQDVIMLLAYAGSSRGTVLERDC